MKGLIRIAAPLPRLWRSYAAWMGRPTEHSIWSWSGLFKYSVEVASGGVASPYWFDVLVLCSNHNFAINFYILRSECYTGRGA